jgi:anti-sigma B factor antagonist
LATLLYAGQELELGVITNSRIAVEDYAGVTLVTFNEQSILDSPVIEQFGRDLCGLADKQDRPRFVLNFVNVKILASLMLGVLLTVLKHTEMRKGGVLLCGLRPELRKVFTITSLDKVFKFCADDVEGLAEFGVRITRGIPDARQQI